MEKELEMKKLALLTAAAFAINTVAANEEPSQSGFYIGADLGLVQHVIDDDGVEAESGTTKSVGLEAGFRFNERWSLGLSHTNFGEAELDSYRDSWGDQITLSSRGKATGVFVGYETDRMPQDWSLGFRLGLAKMFGELIIEDESIGKFGFSDSRINVFGGLAANYNFSDEMQLRFTADWFVFSPEFEDDFKLDMQFSKYAVGLVYAF
jgi:hypothetical protein